ncbi:PLAC8 family-domain-containing protein [Clohesyomyces aquaticus]|uniref:PLAC8 family-domain-containing protein n=1 Tax=Clohesyomyces aquaticus TaxID=1231657 RepID=A0A1Y1ZYL5_9PLEO|nr:PLAC8 family-domain-containing protein [Clohesyomyces aquaticus]
MDRGQYSQQQQRLQPQHGEPQHQRFSWQPPPPEEETAVQPQQQQRQPQRQQPQYQEPQQHQHRQQQRPQINTDVNPHTRAFSYAQTPIEHQPIYTTASNAPPLPQPQSPSSPVDPRPQSIYNPHNRPHAQPQPHQTHPAYASYHNESASYPDEKAPLSPTSPYTSAPPQYPAITSPISPVAQPQPVVHSQQQSRHARQRSNLSPINTNVAQHTIPPIPAQPPSYASATSPLPTKAPITPISGSAIKKEPMSPINARGSVVPEPYSPHGFSSNAAGGSNAIFSPNAATGPNGFDFALHQPGQIAHPNMEAEGKGSSHEWKHSLCECSSDISTCFTGLFCPCILYGRTSYRLSQKSDKKDPTDMLGYKATNGHCMLMGVACGLQWLFPMVHRTKLRHMYKLSGSCGSDFVKSCCCCCCVAIQNEREVRDREESKRQWAGPASTEMYRAPERMVYSPQR